MTKSYPMFIVDAFTDHAFGGNPAAVCLLDSDDEISDEIKQKLGNEMNLSETVFLSKLDPRIDFQTGNTFGIRWFTPTTEVPLCGHATLAAVKVVFEVFGNKNPKLTLETKLSGTVYAKSNDDGKIVLDFPNHKPHKIWHNRFDSVIKMVFGDLPHIDVQFGYETRKLLVRLDDRVQRSEFESFTPCFDEMAKLDINIEGVIATVKGSRENGFLDESGEDIYDFASRYFATWVGVNEDPVCGSAHSVLAPYWSEVLGKKELKAVQCSARIGKLYLKIQDDNRVDIGGNAKIVVKGSIDI